MQLERRASPPVLVSYIDGDLSGQVRVQVPGELVRDGVPQDGGGRLRR